MTDFFNTHAKKSKMCEIRGITTKRRAADLSELNDRVWDVISISRGKEIKLIFTIGKIKRELLVYFFKGGVWEFYENEEATKINPNYFRDHRFSIHFENGTILAHQDQFHQSHWKWKDIRFEWGPYRSPDIVLEHNEFRRYMYANSRHPYMETPVFKVMMHQRFFNGLNNFSRCEILARTRFSPFTTMREILSVPILREDLFDTCKNVLEDIYNMGGMQFGLWVNPFGADKIALRNWVQVYKPGGKNTYFVVFDGEKLLYVHNRWRTEFNARGYPIIAKQSSTRIKAGSNARNDI